MAFSPSSHSDRTLCVRETGRASKTKRHPQGLSGRFKRRKSRPLLTWAGASRASPLATLPRVAHHTRALGPHALRARDREGIEQKTDNHKGCPFFVGAPPGTRSRGGVRKGEGNSPFLHPLVGRGSDDRSGRHSLPLLLIPLSRHLISQSKKPPRGWLFSGNFAYGR